MSPERRKKSSLSDSAGLPLDEQKKGAAMERYALKFPDVQTLIRGLEVVEELTKQDAETAKPPVEIYPGGRNALLMSESSYRRIAPALEKAEIEYDGMRAIAMSELSPAERARVRGQSGSLQKGKR
jgi:hypothetical protein